MSAGLTRGVGGAVRLGAKTPGGRGLLNSDVGPAGEELHVPPTWRPVKLKTSRESSSGGWLPLPPCLVLSFFILEGPEFEGCFLSIVQIWSRTTTLGSPVFWSYFSFSGWVPLEEHSKVSAWITHPLFSKITHDTVPPDKLRSIQVSQDVFALQGTLSVLMTTPWERQLRFYSFRVSALIGRDPTTLLLDFQIILCIW